LHSGKLLATVKGYDPLHFLKQIEDFFGELDTNKFELDDGGTHLVIGPTIYFSYLSLSNDVLHFF